jgi:hypothetical protein
MSICRIPLYALAVIAAGWLAPSSPAQPPQKPPAAEEKEPPEFPPFDEVAKDFEKVVMPGGEQGFWTLWRRDKDAQLLAELPKDFEGKRFYLAPTIAAGDDEAGVLTMWTRWGAPGDRYVYWNRYDKRLALIEPNLAVRSTGDEQSKAAVERIYTDRVVLDLPIACMGPDGGPVIDLDDLMIAHADAFFGAFTQGANPALAKIVAAKTFPNNAELSIELPVRDGTLATLHYSFGRIPENPDYQPRVADRRVGFFYTNWTDRSRNDGESQTVRYIQRWDLRKKDPNLKLSPPARPIVFYIEHTTPIRYRRWVRDALLEWNKAFEKVGIVNAIEVYQQDAATGAHMDKDPEDVRYNFIRWTNSHMGYAIGPVRVNPETGQILDADIVMDEVFISGWAKEFAELLPEAAMRGLDAQTVNWLASHENWDPRLRLADPAQRDAVRARLATERAAPQAAPRTLLQQTMLGSRTPCQSQRGRAYAVAAARLALDAGMLTLRNDDPDEPKDDKQGLLDGLPEEFVGPLLKDVIMHEVGHTLGLMHNFKASSVYTIEQINSPEWKGHKTVAGSVMDYLADNISPDPKTQGDFCMSTIGPYDYWAIEWGYTTANPDDVAKRAAEPELAFLSDETVTGPDPQGRVWDFSADSLAWARTQIDLVARLRAKLLDRVVKDGQSWQKARRGYTLLLGRQLSAVSAASGWIGGASVARDRKGDPNGRDPLTVTPAQKQRDALTFVMENSFRDAAFGLTPALLTKMGADQWWDEEGFDDAPDWPVNDRVLGVQASVLTRLMNPMVLRRVYDNELRTPPGQDMLTMPELLASIRAEIWSELAAGVKGRPTARQPMITPFRRNLQREHLDRLVTLSTEGDWWGGASSRPLTNLARQELRDLKLAIDKIDPDKADPYTRAHLADAGARIAKALEAAYIRRD